MEHNQILLQFGADLVFYMSLNGIGFYIKYVRWISDPKLKPKEDII